MRLGCDEEGLIQLVAVRRLRRVAERLAGELVALNDRERARGRSHNLLNIRLVRLWALEQAVQLANELGGILPKSKAVARVRRRGRE